MDSKEGLKQTLDNFIQSTRFALSPSSFTKSPVRFLCLLRNTISNNIYTGIFVGKTTIITTNQIYENNECDKFDDFEVLYPPKSRFKIKLTPKLSFAFRSVSISETEIGQFLTYGFHPTILYLNGRELDEDEDASYPFVKNIKMEIKEFEHFSEDIHCFSFDNIQDIDEIKIFKCISKLDIIQSTNKISYTMSLKNYDKGTPLFYFIDNGFYIIGVHHETNEHFQNIGVLAGNSHLFTNFKKYKDRPSITDKRMSKLKSQTFCFNTKFEADEIIDSQPLFISWKKPEPKIEIIEDIVSPLNLPRKADRRHRVAHSTDARHQLIVENVQKIENIKNPSEETKNQIRATLKKHFLFYKLDSEKIDLLINKMFLCECSKNTYVFKQGDQQTTCFFYIAEGELNVEIGNVVKKNLKAGETFGDLALLYSSPRSASIKSVTDCKFWALNRHTFKHMLEESNQEEFEENWRFLEKTSFFQKMSQEQREHITKLVTTQKFEIGDDIVTQGELASSYYIIKEGTVICLKDEVEVRELNEGDSFGEQALFYNATRLLTVRAKTITKVLAVARDKIASILGGQMQDLIFKNSLRWLLDHDKLLVQLTKLQREKAIDSFSYKSVEENDVIIAEGDTIKSIIVLIQGVARNKSLNEIYKEGKIFLQEYLKSKVVMKNPFDIVMESAGVVCKLHFDKLLKVLGGSFDEAIIKNENSHERKKYELSSDLKQKLIHVKLENLINIKKLGEGQFGRVHLVYDPPSKLSFALKIMAKKMIVEDNIQEYVMQEKKILQTVKHPFVVGLHKTFKDQHNIYILMEYVKGLELWDVIRQIGYLNNNEAKFYAASMILVLEYLNNHDIVYRDLKPENIMIDEFGYIRFIDFGTAKVIVAKQGTKRTSTILGTPHYMAPEVIDGSGYTFTADLWSMGICVYEFMVGCVPFANESEDPFEIYHEIGISPLKFPKFFVKPENTLAIKFIEQMLSKTPQSRLDSGGFASLKAGKWFDSINWDDLFEKKFKPPYITPKNMLPDEEFINKEASLEIKIQTIYRTPENDIVSLKDDWEKDFLQDKNK